MHDALPKPASKPSYPTKNTNLPLILGLLLFVGVGCPVERSDPFECGSMLGDQVRVCDGNAEVCICGERRCAVEDRRKCPGDGERSSYRYVFDEDDDPSCIAPERLRVVATTELCPELRREAACGSPTESEANRGCAPNQLCSCTESRCVTPVAPGLGSCPDSGFFYSHDGSCLTGMSGAALQYDLPGADGICPERRAEPPARCGTAPEVSCETGICSCLTGRCIAHDPHISACPLGWVTTDDPLRCILRDEGDTPTYAWRHTNVALMSNDPDEVDALVSATLLRPGQATCNTPPPAHRSCGEDSTQTCGIGWCLCSDRPQCVVDASWCATGVAYQVDLSCAPIDVEDREHYRVDSDGRCEELKSVPPECGLLNEDGEPIVCPANTVCSCRDQRCVERAGVACRSGWRYATNDRCLGNPVDADECPSGFAWRSDGTCITHDGEGQMDIEPLVSPETTCEEETP